MAVSLEQFSKQLVDSGAISESELHSFVAKLSEAEKPADAEQLAKRLVREKKISAYQAQVIYSGKGKSLTMGSYFVLDKLGQGGMGMVLKAQHRMMKRLVAIKVLSPTVTKTKELQQRFQREVEAAARLTHSNIVGAFDAGESNGSPFLVMEYVPGDDLSSIVKTKGPLSVDQAIDCIIQAARGLEFAHNQGVIHRDIKPANLLLDTKGVVKILDMGLARIDANDVATQADLTGTGAVMGTVDYMAPEQALSTKHADARSDLYSLGISLWYLLTGKAAYEGDSLMARLLAHREQPIPSLRAVRSDISESLDRVFRKLVAKKSTERYQTASELIVDLEACRSGATLKAVTVAEVATGANEFQDFLQQIDSPTEGPQGSKPNPSLPATRTLPKTQRPVSATEETLVRPDGSDTLPLRKKKVRKSKALPWYQDLRVQIGGAATAVVLLGVFLMSGRGARRVEQQENTQVAPSGIADSKGSNPQAATVNRAEPSKPTAPAPAIAPFSAAQAKQHQEAWAAHLGVPVEYTNSIGMKFLLIPPGEFTMGGTASEVEQAATASASDVDQRWRQYIPSEAPQHRVVLTQPFYLATCEVTQTEYEGIMGMNSSYFPSPGQRRAMERVSWNDAAEFCSKLSAKEQLTPHYSRTADTVTIGIGDGYRLPTEAQWEFACRAGTTTRYWNGDQPSDLEQIAWFRTNSTKAGTHVVGELRANPFGLFDVLGNVTEWVQDWWGPKYYDESKDSAIDPMGPTTGTERVFRGGDWYNLASDCRSSTRRAWDPSPREQLIGFRLLLPVKAVKETITSRVTHPSVAATVSPEPAAIAPFSSEQARRYQDRWAGHLGVPVEYTNSIGMKFRLIPPGEFMMGSAPAEIEEAQRVVNYKPVNDNIATEGPQHKVILSHGFYLGIHEVTQAQYRHVMGTNPSDFSSTGNSKDAVAGLDTLQHPVDMVTWNDAAEFCEKLSQQETFKPFYARVGDQVTLVEGMGYRLPTEAEWEFACRAGTTTKYWVSDRDDDLPQAAWIRVNSGNRTHPVGELKANPFGLYDIHGNVWEWVHDAHEPNYYQQFEAKTAVDPINPFSTDSKHVIRGGHWVDIPSFCRSAVHHAYAMPWRLSSTGLRVALSVEAVKSPKASRTVASPAAPIAVAPPKQPLDPKTAYLSGQDAGPDFEIQGEYAGKLGNQPVGVQVIARGQGKFDGVVFPGGLPGAGWDELKPVGHGLTGETTGNSTTLKGGDFEATITPGVLVLKQGTISGELRKQIRQSPTLGQRPPKGAIILFDGKNVDQWNPGKMAEQNLMGIGSRTNQTFENYTLHIEFRTPFMPFGNGQGRGNSGLYLGDQYELQILDSFGLEGADNECGGIYRNAKPLVNMCFPPLSWQTYDINFTCARFNSKGDVTAPAKVTVKHNGVVIHDNQSLQPTPGGGRTDQKPGALYIQDHGNPVRFQNIWLLPRK